ncbi:response regulator transcription factor [Foetidibacter luteolus]|uniref:response regulator transcription factor n=1 Tax=Foetidibacter luteolus TaxID=2608880 RepID=UPI00129AFA02|nr:response regulator transcription factor [Foetidibacter luteolus]
MKICIIDDHLLMAESLKSLLTTSYTDAEIRIYASAEDFLEDDFSNWTPNVVLSDILLPGMSGIQLLSRISLPGTKIIMLTSVIDITLVKDTMTKGVSGFVTKDVTSQELIDAIQTAMSGGQYINRSLKDKIVEELFSEKPTTFNLSKRENEVLQLICSGNTPKEIAAMMNLSTYTIQQYIKNMMRKFKVNRTTEMVVLAIAEGLYKPTQYKER